MTTMTTAQADELLRQCGVPSFKTAAETCGLTITETRPRDVGGIWTVGKAISTMGFNVVWHCLHFDKPSVYGIPTVDQPEGSKVSKLMIREVGSTDVLYSYDRGDDEGLDPSARFIFDAIMERFA